MFSSLFILSLAAGALGDCFPGAVVDRRPHVQCDRAPPCIRWSWLTEQRCAERPRDEDWLPYSDPDLVRTTHWVPIRHLFHTKLRSKRVWVVGDSINNLVYSGLLCEAARHKMHYAIDQQMTTLFKSPEYASTWFPDAPYSAHYFPDTNTTLIQKGWHHYNRTDFTSILSLSDVVLVNYALHYHDMLEYEEKMKEMFQQLNEWPGQAFFRETGPQFFENTGAYTRPNTGDSGYTCAPMTDNVVWNNQIHHQNEIVRRISPTRVAIIPFYNLTLNRWRQMEGRYCQAEARASGESESTCLDCTHFCFSPVLWSAFVDRWFHLF